MDNLYFENVVKIGKLYLEYVFYEFESEPILFLCRDENSDIYLCLCSEIRYGQKWIISKCNLTVLKDLINEKIDIASAFLINPNMIIIESDLQGHENSYIIKSDEIDELDLPKKGTYVKCDKQTADDFLRNKELELSKQSKSTYDISFVDDEIIESYSSTINKMISILNKKTMPYNNSVFIENIKLTDSFDKILKPSISDDCKLFTYTDKYNITSNKTYTIKNSNCSIAV